MGSETRVLVNKVVDIDPGDFWSMRIAVQKGDEIEIFVIEKDEYDFDVLLLPDEAVDEEGFYDSDALLNAEHETYFHETYQFPRKGMYRLVISCLRAREVIREVKVKVTRTRETNRDENTGQSKGSKSEDRQSGEKQLSVEGVVKVARVLLSYASLSLVAGFVSPVGGAVVLSVGGALLAIFRNEIRILLGLQSGE